jgi:hypothetical protein
MIDRCAFTLSWIDVCHCILQNESEGLWWSAKYGIQMKMTPGTSVKLSKVPVDIRCSRFLSRPLTQKWLWRLSTGSDATDPHPLMDLTSRWWYRPSSTWYMYLEPVWSSQTKYLCFVFQACNFSSDRLISSCLSSHVCHWKPKMLYKLLERIEFPLFWWLPSLHAWSLSKLKT